MPSLRSLPIQALFTLGWLPSLRNDGKLRRRWKFPRELPDDRDKKGFLEFLPDPFDPHLCTLECFSLTFPGTFQRFEELGVIQIRLIPVIFQSFIRRRRWAVRR